VRKAVVVGIGGARKRGYRARMFPRGSTQQTLLGGYGTCRIREVGETAGGGRTGFVQ
jgi:hypothetical protein